MGAAAAEAGECTCTVGGQPCSLLLLFIYMCAHELHLAGNVCVRPWQASQLRTAAPQRWQRTEARASMDLGLMYSG